MKDLWGAQIQSINLAYVSVIMMVSLWLPTVELYPLKGDRRVSNYTGPIDALSIHVLVNEQWTFHLLAEIRLLEPWTFSIDGVESMSRNFLGDFRWKLQWNFVMNFHEISSESFKWSKFCDQNFMKFDSKVSSNFSHNWKSIDLKMSGQATSLNRDFRFLAEPS